MSCDRNTSLLYCTDDLIYRPYSNDVIGYADTGDDSINSMGSSEEKVADHMLAVYVRGVCIKETVSHICMFILNESIKPVHLFFLSKCRIMFALCHCLVVLIFGMERT